MSERLQNIINGIDSGNIKSVYNFNLTMEELFTRDSNGIYFLEYLLKRKIMIPLELKEKLKTNALAAYLYCKNDQSIFSFKLSEKDLFTIVDGKRLIDTILEKKSISGNIVKSINENIEIVDLLCTSDNYFYLSYLTENIITKLITKDSNGIYPIEKYLNNERLIEKVIPLVNNIDALLEICTKYNNYSFMKYTNENLLIEDLKLRLKGRHGLRVWMSI